MPWPVQLVFLVLLFVLGGLILTTSTGLLGRGAASLAGTAAGLAGHLLPSSPTPRPSPTPATPPELTPAQSRYTSQTTNDVTGNVPAADRDVAGATIRVYDNGQLVGTLDVPTTADFAVVGVPLVEGDNQITATVATAAGESDPSAAITIVRDDEAPKISLTSPRNGAQIKSSSVTVSGTTQAGSSVTVLNTNTGGSTTVIADGEGAFSVSLIVGDGHNDLIVTATDPAGNSTTANRTVSRAPSDLKARLTVSPSRTPASAPKPLEVTVIVTDSHGRPIDGGTATFSAAPPNEGAEVSDPLPIASGVATWSVVLPPEAPGAGLITVQVGLRDGRTASANASFTLTP
jgi:hypothetical protein